MPEEEKVEVVVETVEPSPENNTEVVVESTPIGVETDPTPAE